MDEAVAIPNAAARNSSSTHALRLLSLDGGGIRGISVLVILDEIMHRLQRAEKLRSVPLPADYFDLICGTSTGGLIALLLGRLRLSVPEAIEKYRVLAAQVFSERKGPGKDGIFKASNLEKAIKTIVEERLDNAEERMWVDSGVCKTFVCAVPAKLINKEPVLFRTWCAASDPGYDCTIWEAGRATTAAPKLFKRIFIGDTGFQEEFIDAALGCNNPLRYLVKEAQREFGTTTPMREVSCIVSIGTGMRKVAGFKKPNLFQRALPSDLIKVLASMATDTEDEEKLARDRYKSCPGLYHRLNVERGLEEVSLEEWKKLGEIKTHTRAYLRGYDASNDIDAIVKALVGRPLRTFPLGRLDGALLGPSYTPSRFIYPPYRVNHFVPRFGLRKEIQKQFQASNTTLIPVVVVLYGIGGCGKSQLALEYCQQSENENSYSSIFWIDAMSPSTVEHSFNSLARGLSMPGFDVQNTEASILYVHERLKTWPGRWLLVFDTFDDPPSFRRKSIKDYFPRSRGGSILVTSRVRETILLGYPIDVSTMSEAEALQLLLGRVKRDHEIMSGTDLLEAKKIVERLGFHALAIDQAGAYICLGDYDLNVFLEHYNKRRKAVLSAKPNLWGYKRKLKSNSDFKTELTVFTTWELSFDLITGDQQIRDDKEHLLTLIAFFDKNKISDTLFKLYSSKNSGWMTSCTENGVWDELKLQDILKELRNLSLIQSLRIQQSGATISLHPLIQDWIKLRISHKSQWAYATEAIQVISISIELQQLHETTFEDKQTTVAHINSVIQNKQECLRQENYIEDQFILDGYSKFVLFLEEFGQHKRAEELCRYERKRREELHSLEDPATLGCMSTLAAVLRSQGKYEEAEPLFRQTLALQKMVLGFEHRDTLTAMNNFALLLHSQDSFGEAEPLFRQSLASAETVLGLDDSLTLTIMNNLAYLLDSQGKYEEAEPLFRQTLALQKVVLGPEHVDTLATTNNLAGLFDDQGKSDEAEPLYRQTLALAEIFLGPKHPLTLTVVNNLALLLENQGEYNSAELLLKKTLPLIKEVLGLKHRSTLLAMHLLLRLLVRKCKPDEANPLFWETFTLSESVLGVKHPETLTAMSNLACLLHIQGKYDESESIFLQAIALRKEVLGPEHLNTLYIVDQLRFLLQYKGKEKPKPPLVLSFL